MFKLKLIHEEHQGKKPIVALREIPTQGINIVALEIGPLRVFVIFVGFPDKNSPVAGYFWNKPLPTLIASK